MWPLAGFGAVTLLVRQQEGYPARKIYCFSNPHRFLCGRPVEDPASSLEDLTVKQARRWHWQYVPVLCSKNLRHFNIHHVHIK